MENPQPVTTSRRPWIIAAIWGCLLIGVVAIGIGVSRPGSTEAANAGGALPLAAPSAAPSVAPAPSGSATPGVGPFRAGPGRKDWGEGPMFGWNAPAGGRGVHGAPLGAITITAINGTSISLRTDDGWTRTIDVSGATVHSGSTTITAGDLKVGDQITFRETRNADGSFTINDINVVPPHVAGTVQAVAASSVTVKQPDGTTRTLTLTGSTTYHVAGTTATKDALVVGARIAATGTVSAGGTFTATAITIVPDVVTGTVSATGSTSITVTDSQGGTITVTVTPTTTISIPGTTNATLSDIQAQARVMVQGVRTGSGSITAFAIRVGVPGQGHAPNGAGPHGPRGGGPWWGERGEPGPNASPALHTNNG